jgi:hypothetical protein
MEETIYGKLFNKIILNDEGHLEVLLDTMDRERAIYLLVESVKHCHNMGVFTLGESEVISKSIRVLNRDYNNKELDNDIN